MWSINAAKKKDDVIPGTSKWIRRELNTLHEQMTTDAEQFAYTVAAEITWIDEQMREILNATELNPRLLLESPSKLRSKESPVKLIRSQALSNLKSPLKSTPSANVSTLSPIRIRKTRSTPSKSTSPANIRLFRSPIRQDLEAAELDNSFLKSSTPLVTKTVPVQSLDDSLKSPIFKSREASVVQTSIEAVASRSTPTRYLKLQAPVATQANFKETSSKTPTDVNKPNAELENQAPLLTTEFSTESKTSKAQSNANKEPPANVDLQSLNSIRAAIRKSMRSKNSNTSHSDNSYRSAVEDVSQDLSTVGHHKSDNLPTSASTQQATKTQTSNSTIQARLNDENPSSHLTPSKPGDIPRERRESQVFSLLPDRGPLSVKSTKKPTASAATNMVKIQDHPYSNSPKERTQSPTLFTKTLFPTTSNGSAPSSNPTINLSPLAKLSNINQPTLKTVENPTTLKKSNTELIRTQATDLSPVRIKNLNQASPHKLSFSPLTDLFASVGNSIKNIREKVTKGPILNNTHKDEERGSKKATFVNAARNIDFTFGSQSNTRRSPEKIKRTTPDFYIDDIFQDRAQTSTTIVPDHGQAVGPSKVKEKFAMSDISGEDDEIFKNSSMKLSPVKIIRGPSFNIDRKQSQVLNSPVKRSPSKPPTRVSDARFVNELKSKVTINQPAPPQLPRSLTRVSLSAHANEQRSNLPRKSYVKSGGLTSMALDGKSRAPNSLLTRHDYQLPAKRQLPEENQQPRKLTKLSLVTATSTTNLRQSQQYKPLDLKRRSLEQAQSVLQKKASRISQEPVVMVKESAKPIIKTKYNNPFTTASLTKTAIISSGNNDNEYRDKRLLERVSSVLPASTTTTTTTIKISPVLNNPKRKTNVITTKTSPSHEAKTQEEKSKPCLKPTEPVALPEIYSGSEAEEDDSVLISWANSPYLRTTLQQQQRMDPDKLFGKMPELQMDDIFGNTRRVQKLHKRGSSAHWGYATMNNEKR